MRRGEFITLLGGTAAWPVVAHAQQVAKVPVIGFLGAGTAAAGNRWFAAFVQRLRELGWIEGQTVSIEYRWADGAQRTVRRDRRRIGPAQGCCHSHLLEHRSRCHKDGNDYSSCICRGGRPYRHWPRRISCAARRKRHPCAIRNSIGRDCGWRSYINLDFVSSSKIISLQFEKCR